MGFPSGLVVKKSVCNAGGPREAHGFDLWVKKTHWSWKWQHTPLFLPGKFCGQRSLHLHIEWEVLIAQKGSFLSKVCFGFLEEGMATYSSIPAWRISIPRTEEPGRLCSTGSQRVRYDFWKINGPTDMNRGFQNSVFHKMFKLFGGLLNLLWEFGTEFLSQRIFETKLNRWN